MAHQTDKIPWKALADLFVYRFRDEDHDGVTNLYPRHKPEQDTELASFVQAFTKTMDEDVESEFRKYPKYEPVDADTVVLDDRAATKITPTLRRARRQYSLRSGADANPPRARARAIGRLNRSPNPAHASCINEETGPKFGRCECSLPIEDRKMSAFLHPAHEDVPCHRCFDSHESLDWYLGWDTIKTLILEDEMEAVLRICCHPQMEVLQVDNSRICECSGASVGWDALYESTLLSYICLNVLYCYPQLRDPASGRTEDNDYRLTSAYQGALNESIPYSGLADLHKYAHRQFYGFSDSNWTVWRSPFVRKPPQTPGYHTYGTLRLPEFVYFDSPEEWRVSRADVSRVRALLMRKGLPMELVLNVMERAKYKPPLDPLHPENREELRDYLEYCWKRMVRCGILARSQGGRMEWEWEVRGALEDLFGCGRHNFTYMWRSADLRLFSLSSLLTW